MYRPRDFTTFQRIVDAVFRVFRYTNCYEALSCLAWTVLLRFPAEPRHQSHRRSLPSPSEVSKNIACLLHRPTAPPTLFQRPRRSRTLRLTAPCLHALTFAVLHGREAEPGSAGSGGIPTPGVFKLYWFLMGFQRVLSQLE